MRAEPSSCALIRIASIEHITAADTIRIISMNNIIVHGIILIIRFTLLESLCSQVHSHLYWNHRCSHLIPVPMVQ